MYTHEQKHLWRLVHKCLEHFEARQEDLSAVQGLHALAPTTLRSWDIVWVSR